MSAVTFSSLANAKQWLGIKTEDNDSLIERLLAAATTFMQSVLNRPILLSAYTETLSGMGGRWQMLPQYPVQAVSAVVVDGTTIPQSTGHGAPGWAFDKYRVVFRPPYCASKGDLNIQVSYEAGYETVPADIEQTCLELLALRFSERTRTGVTSKTLAGETITFSDADLTSAGRTVLNNYKRTVPL